MAGIAITLKHHVDTIDIFALHGVQMLLYLMFNKQAARRSAVIRNMAPTKATKKVVSIVAMLSRLTSEWGAGETANEHSIR